MRAHFGPNKHDRANSGAKRHDGMLRHAVAPVLPPIPEVLKAMSKISALDNSMHTSIRRDDIRKTQQEVELSSQR